MNPVEIVRCALNCGMCPKFGRHRFRPWQRNVVIDVSAFRRGEVQTFALTGMLLGVHAA
jgi:hypothetical protein